MARRRTAVTTDLRSYYLERTLASYRYKWQPQTLDSHLADVREGKPFIVQGWKVNLKPPYADFVIEANGKAVELEVIRHDVGGVEHKVWRRPDGSLVASWPPAAVSC